MFQLRDRRRDLDVVDGGRLEAVGLQNGHLIIGKVNHPAGVFDDRARIRSNNVFIIPHPDDQRRTLARHHERIGLIPAHHRDAVSPLDFVKRKLHRFAQQRRTIAVAAGVQLGIKMPHQHRQHFGIGLA